ncbi:type II secretion system protein G [Elusimicrobium simillimum]|uniref:type IV pilin protein n=1 Tax=Elusimicrobium simillimum TaxID=3143438 RepID=UPI003C6FAB40
MKKGFTLIEMLVVVLIIGILSAIALPQYTKAVDRARLSEAVINVKNITDALQLKLLENGWNVPSAMKAQTDLNIDLTGGTWTTNGKEYETKYFYYTIGCSGGSCDVMVESAKGYEFMFKVVITKKATTKTCTTALTERGQNICKQLESQGYTYQDGDY